ncbi:MAG: phospholipase D family protein, partial [Hyphomicrobiales bacterium]
LLAIDSHPNIEVRMFNPVALRSPRLLGMVADFGRINKRMHNKSFTADGQVSIVGGRNIGDEYFEADDAMNFADLDVAVIGPVVKEVSDAFDLYWNNQSAIPIAALARQNTTPEQFATKRAALVTPHETANSSKYAQSLRDSEFARQLRNRNISYFWGKAMIINDHPDKVATSADKTETHLAPQLRAVVDQTKRELFLVSPYFVPGKKGVELLAGVRQRGPRVVVLTNSLASTDGVPVHSKYQLYRKALIDAGVELYEIKPTVGAQLERRFRGPVGSSTGGLHAKTFAFDRRIGFIGSYNLDPRSSKLNTEMGVLFDCPPLAKRLPEQLERNLGRDAYRVELDRNRLVWVTREGEKEVRYHSDPGASLMKRFKAQVISWLPIEWLL